MEEIIDEIKTAFKGNVYLALKSSISISAVAIVIIWFYLFSIGRQDVFLDSINNISSLIVIVGFSIFVFVIFTSIFMLSSIATVLAFKIYQQDIESYNGFGSHLTRICLTNSCVFWGAFFVLFVFSEKTYPGNGHMHIILLVVAAAGAIANSFRMVSKQLLLATNFNNLKITKTYVPLHAKARIWAKWQFSAILLLPAGVQLCPLLFIFPRLDFGNIHNDFAQLGVVIILVILVSIFTMLPAVAWFAAPKEKGLIYKFKDVVIAIIVTLFVVLSLFRTFTDVVVGSSLRLIGVTDWTSHQYLISIEKFSAAQFPGTKWNTRTYRDIPQRFFITGVPIFSLGNVQLICPEEVLKFRERSMRENIIDPSRHQLIVTELKSYTRQCLNLQKGEATQWDSQLIEPIYEQKLKVNYDDNLIKILHLIK